MTAAADPLSPELALICPELRSRARVALPARPWEGPFGRASRPRTPGPGREGPTGTLAVEPPRPRHLGRFRPASVLAGALVLVLGGAWLVAAKLEPGGVPVVHPAAVRPSAAAPAVSPSAPRAARPARKHEARVTQAGRRVAPPAVAAIRPTAPVPTRRAPVASPGAGHAGPAPRRLQPSPSQPLAKVNLAVPHGGYVFANGGHLRVVDEQRTLASLDLSLPCFGHLVLSAIPIAADGRLATERTARGRSSAFTLRISGVFAAASVHLRVLATGGGCADRRLDVAGRLS